MNKEPQPPGATFSAERPAQSRVYDQTYYNGYGRGRSGPPPGVPGGPPPGGPPPGGTPPGGPPPGGTPPGGP